MTVRVVPTDDDLKAMDEHELENFVLDTNARIEDRVRAQFELQRRHVYGDDPFGVIMNDQDQRPIPDPYRAITIFFAFCSAVVVACLGILVYDFFS